MAPHSSTLAWKIPWMESDTTEQLHFHFSLSCIREGNGNALQSSCLKNPRDGDWAAVYGVYAIYGAWWAAIYGVAQSRTQLQGLSSSSSNHLQLTISNGKRMNAFLLKSNRRQNAHFHDFLEIFYWQF